MTKNRLQQIATNFRMEFKTLQQNLQQIGAETGQVCCRGFSQNSIKQASGG
jgi:hypothetical protein